MSPPVVDEMPFLRFTGCGQQSQRISQRRKSQRQEFLHKQVRNPVFSAVSRKVSLNDRTLVGPERNAPVRSPLRAREPTRTRERGKKKTMLLGRIKRTLHSPWRLLHGLRWLVARHVTCRCERTSSGVVPWYPRRISLSLRAVLGRGSRGG